jgi:hypothetical protein
MSDEVALIRMQTAAEYFADGNAPSKPYTHDRYMDFAEAYADYVCGYEKTVDRGRINRLDANSSECITRKPSEEGS